MGDLLALERRLTRWARARRRCRGGGGARAVDAPPAVAAAAIGASPSAGEAGRRRATARRTRRRRRPRRRRPLARTVARLAAANAELVEERDALRRDARRVAETKRATEALAKKYDAKFEKLRESLDAFRRAYPAPSNPANVLEPGAPAPSLDDLERDARELRAQLAAERDLGRKRDAIIARYEHWYSALKASAAARRRPSHEGSFEA